MKTTPTKKLENGAQCRVIAGTHFGKSGVTQDMHTSKTGAVTITVLQKSGDRFKTLARNVELLRTTQAQVKSANKDITAYNRTQEKWCKALCAQLAKEIDAGLPKAESKVWHGHPVWFLDGNPVVGYAVRKQNVHLLFWSGQSFEEAGLAPEGTFKAAEARYATKDEINSRDLKRWLKKAKTIQWDYKNIVKRRGKLVRLG